MPEIDSKTLQDFLEGNVDDATFQQCQAYLENTQALFSGSLESDDPLIVALQHPPSDSLDWEDPELLRRMEKLANHPVLDRSSVQRWLDPSTEPDSLGRLDRYEITEFMAQGGMGLVFRGWDPRLERVVCLKLLGPQYEYQADVQARFQREAKTASALLHDRIVSIYEVGDQRGLPFLVMPLLRGQSLRALLSQELQVPWGRTLGYIQGVVEGLEFAHRQGVLHRDLKPDNLWVTSEDEIKILDFGLARTVESGEPLTQSGTVLGTPSYMSPEQVLGQSLDARSDLFSVGVIFLEMLTGQAPFRKANVISTLFAITHEPLDWTVQDPEDRVPPQARPVIENLLQKDREDRLASAGELKEVLSDLDTEATRKLLRSQPQRAGGDRGRFIGWGWIAAMAFPVFFALAAMAWQMNDRGTLVVETSDPQVQVKIEASEVAITDPVSGREYQIRVGQTPLPSGVYQLEMEDAQSGLAFSSQTIVIRRGEKTLVTVRWKPDQNKPAIENTIAADKAIAEQDVQQWLNQRKQQQARFVNSLGQLPSLDVTAEVRGIGEGITRLASVSQAAALEETFASEWDAWTIESAPRFDLESVKWNSDRSLGVGPEHQLVDSQGQLLGTLPMSVQWAPTVPHLFESYGSSTDSSGTFQSIAIVWRIDPQTLEMEAIRKIAADRCDWLSDDQLLIRTGRTWSVWNLEDGSSSSFELNYENIALDSVSPDGRFLALHDYEHHRFHLFDRVAWRLSNVVTANSTAQSEALAWQISESGEANVLVLSFINMEFPRQQVLANRHPVDSQQSLSDDFELRIDVDRNSWTVDPNGQWLAWLRHGQLHFHEAKEQGEYLTLPAPDWNKKEVRLRWPKSTVLELRHPNWAEDFRFEEHPRDGAFENHQWVTTDQPKQLRLHWSWDGHSLAFFPPPGSTPSRRVANQLDLQTLLPAAEGNSRYKPLAESLLRELEQTPVFVSGSNRQDNYGWRMVEELKFSDDRNVFVLGYSNFLLPFCAGPGLSSRQLLKALPDDIGIGTGRGSLSSKLLRLSSVWDLPPANLDDRKEVGLRGIIRIQRWNDGLLLLMQKQTEGFPLSWGWLDVKSGTYHEGVALPADGNCLLWCAAKGRIWFADNGPDPKLYSGEIDKLLEGGSYESIEIPDQVEQRWKKAEGIVSWTQESVICLTNQLEPYAAYELVAEPEMGIRQCEELSGYRMTHSRFPSVAGAEKIGYFSNGEFHLTGRFIGSHSATDFGWGTIEGPGATACARDPQGRILGTATFAGYLVDGAPVDGSWVLANGAIAGQATPSAFGFFARQGTTYKAMRLDQYLEQKSSQDVPRFDQLPFLGNTEQFDRSEAKSTIRDKNKAESANEPATPLTPEEVADRYANLPALPPVGEFVPGENLATGTLLQTDPQGSDRFWIDPDWKPETVCWNSDQSLGLAICNWNLVIVDPQLAIQHVLPVTAGLPTQLQWAPQQPNLFSVSYDPQPSSFAQVDTLHDFWQIRPDGLARIRQLDVPARVHWVDDQHVMFLRGKKLVRSNLLTSQETESTQDVTGEGTTWISPDRRWLAFFKETRASLYDVATMQSRFELPIRREEHFWSRDHQRLAIWQQDTPTIFVIDLATAQVVKEHPMGSAVGDPVLDPNCQRVAWFNRNQNLELLDLQSNRVNAYPLEDSVAGTLNWSQNQLEIHLNGRRFVWRPTTDSVDGDLVAVSGPQSGIDSGRRAELSLRSTRWDYYWKYWKFQEPSSQWVRLEATMDPAKLDFEISSRSVADDRGGPVETRTHHPELSITSHKRRIQAASWLSPDGPVPIQTLVPFPIAMGAAHEDLPVLQVITTFGNRLVLRFAGTSSKPERLGFIDLETRQFQELDELSEMHYLKFLHVDRETLYLWWSDQTTEPKANQFVSAITLADKPNAYDVKRYPVRPEVVEVVNSGVPFIVDGYFVSTTHRERDVHIWSLEDLSAADAMQRACHMKLRSPSRYSGCYATLSGLLFRWGSIALEAYQIPTETVEQRRLHYSAGCELSLEADGRIRFVTFSSSLMELENGWQSSRGNQILHWNAEGILEDVAYFRTYLKAGMPEAVGWRSQSLSASDPQNGWFEVAVEDQLMKTRRIDGQPKSTGDVSIK